MEQVALGSPMMHKWRPRLPLHWVLMWCQYGCILGIDVITIWMYFGSIDVLLIWMQFGYWCYNDMEYGCILGIDLLPVWVQFGYWCVSSMDAFWVLRCCWYGCSLGIDALKQGGIDVNVGALVQCGERSPTNMIETLHFEYWYDANMGAVVVERDVPQMWGTLIYGEDKVLSCL